MTSVDAQYLLNRTPYLFSDDREPTWEIEKINEVQEHLRNRLGNVVNRLRERGLYAEVTSQTRTKEVYETNAIEYVGPSFKRTIEILETDGMVRRVEEAVRRGMFLTSISSEPEILSVVGVYGAREFASTLLESDPSRPMVEMDIRSIHSLIASGERYAGSYREIEIAIQGAEHKPPLAISVSGHMHSLMNWINDSEGQLPETLRAAVAHAWLTHIHPFEDGNGRLARILVNMMTMRANLPPVILRHSADREEYLDALGHSDKGGDVLPFAFVLMKAMKRTMREIEKPRFLRGIFMAEMAARGESLFDHWATSIDAFVNRLAYQLKLYRYTVTFVGTVDRASFELLKEGNRGGNSWFLRISAEDKREILIWVGFSSVVASRYISGSYRLPSLRLSVRDYENRLRAYGLIERGKIEGLSEIVIEPDVNPRVHMAFDTVQRFELSEGADRLASIIARAFSSGVVPAHRPTMVASRTSE